jgi:hypothetical protein
MYYPPSIFKLFLDIKYERVNLICGGYGKNKNSFKKL